MGIINKSHDISKRKKYLLDHANRMASTREKWFARNKYFHQTDNDYFRFLIPAGQRVLALGTQTGQLLAELKPSHGVGIDISPDAVKSAQNHYPHLEFHIGDIEDAAFLSSIHGKFDYLVINDTIGYMEDCEQSLALLHRFCTPDTRIVVSYYAWFWEPILKLAESVGLHAPMVELNWLSTDDIVALLELAGYETIKREWRQLVPRRLFGIGSFLNRYVGTLPFIRKLCLRNYIVARPKIKHHDKELSATVLVPCRNEKGNIESAILRTPKFSPKIEFIFVEGGSSDGTYEECLRVQAAYPKVDIKVLKQDGKGKGDAVRKGFAAASGEVLMILDADLTMPPEYLPRYYNALASGKAEFVHGTRLVYPMQDEAMRFLNVWANRTFSLIFSWLLNQRFTDTLCGTKVLTKADYNKIVENRAYFGEFDPFGDFDLIFGAAKLNLKILEIPVRYEARTYGETQISRFTHGFLLLRMVVFAFKKLKAF